MDRRTIIRRFTIPFTLALTALVVVFVHLSSASSARMIIYGGRTASCDRTGADSAATVQRSRIGIQLQGFRDREVATVDITFPDGRIFSLDSAQLLDGVVDMPVNFATTLRTDLGGDLYFDYPITPKFPYGCYILTGRGLESGKSAQASLVVVPNVGLAPDPGQARLFVFDGTTGDTSSQQGAAVDVFGRGFLAEELVSVWITAPDGAVIDYPQQLTSNAGNFESTFQFKETNPTGIYKFTALGTISKYQVITDFNLTSRQSVQRGFAEVHVAFPADQSNPQRTQFEVQGTRFNPFERVDIWVTLPDGAVRGLPSQFVDQFGNFFADLYLDERLPTGEYDFTAKGAESGSVVITTLQLQQTQNITPNFVPGPEVIDSNNDLTGSPTNIQGAEGNPGPQISTPDQLPPPEILPPIPGF